MNSEYQDEELAAAAAKAAHSRMSDKRWKQRLAALAIAFALLSTMTIFLAVTNGQLAEENASFGAQQQGEKKEIAKEASQALCGRGETQIYDRELCDKWAEAAQEPTVTQPAAPLDSGPTQAELVNAFRAYCDEGNCRGRDGQPPTPDDIAAAFMTFCADGRCTGPAGQNGKDGDSPAPLAPQYEMVLAAVREVCGTGVCNGPTGERGPGPTEEMVLAAVTTVCANDACRGPAGPAGADSTVPGPAGEPGRGIADTYCADSGLWQITYTDGEVDTDGGACREPKPSIPPIEVTP